MWRASLAAIAASLCLPVVATAGGPGATVGIVRTSIGADGWSASSGADVGVFFSLGALKGIGIQPEVRFVRRAADSTLEGGAAALSGSLAVDYVELPVLLRVRLGGPRTVTPTLCAGAYGAYRSRARFTLTAGDISHEADAASETRQWQSGLVLGAGVEIGRGNLKWIGEARYTRDFTSLGIPDSGLEGVASTLRILVGARWE